MFPRWRETTDPTYQHANPKKTEKTEKGANNSSLSVLDFEGFVEYTL